MPVEIDLSVVATPEGNVLTAAGLLSTSPSPF